MLENLYLCMKNKVISNTFAKMNWFDLLDFYFEHLSLKNSTSNLALEEYSE